MAALLRRTGGCAPSSRGISNQRGRVTENTFPLKVRQTATRNAVMPDYYVCDVARGGRSRNLLVVLGVVDRVPFQPVLIAYLVDVLQSAGNDARTQETAFPRDGCAKTEYATKETVGQRSACRIVAASRTGTQQAEANSDGGGFQGMANGLAKKRSQGPAMEKRFSPGTGSFQS